MAVEGSAGDLLPVVMLLGAAVVDVPIFKRLGLGAALLMQTGGLSMAMGVVARHAGKFRIIGNLPS